MENLIISQYALKEIKKFFFQFLYLSMTSNIRKQKKNSCIQKYQKKNNNNYSFIFTLFRAESIWWLERNFQFENYKHQSKKNRITSVNDCTIRLNIPLIFLGDKLSSSLITSISLPCRPIAMRMHFLKEKFKKKSIFFNFFKYKKMKIKNYAKKLFIK